MASTNSRPTPLKLDVVVNRQSPEPDLRRILPKIRPKWIKQDDIIIQIRSNDDQNCITMATDVKYVPCPGTGFVNATILATYKDNLDDDAVVIRVFDPTIDYVMHRERELAANLIFNERKLSPEIYCTFKNGLCMDFIKGDNYGWGYFLGGKCLDDEKILKSAARELAKYHSKKTSDLAREKFPNLFPMVPELRNKSEEFLKNWPDTILHDEEADVLFKAKFPSKATMESEWKQLLEMMEGLGLPLVLCHNDAHPSNLLYVPKNDRTIFVDYEMSGYSWPSIDLSTFLEYSAIGLPVDNKFPRHPVPVRKMFLREYLETQRSLGDLDHDVTDRDVERLLVQVEKTTLPFFLFYIGCVHSVALTPAKHGISKKQIVEIGINEFDWYLRNKERILALEIPA